MAVLTRAREVGRFDRYDGGAVERVLARIRLPLDRAYLRRYGFLDELAALSRGADAAVPPPACRVLVVSLRSWTSHTAYESVIAQALRLRGAHVALLTCGGGLPICEVGWARRATPRPCDRCAWFTDRVRHAAGIRSYRLVDYLPWGGDPRRAPVHVNGGEVDPAYAASISIPWFTKTPDAHLHPDGEAIASDFRTTATGVEQAATAILDDFRPDVVVMVNGLFAPERVIRELALARGMRVPTYEIAPRANALVFDQCEPAPMYATGAAWERVRGRPLTAGQQAAIEGLLSDRIRGIGAHESHFQRAKHDEVAVREALDLPSSGRVISLFTNIGWDSAALQRDVGFDSMLDWIEHAVRSAAAARDVTLVVRIHPAEMRWGNREDATAIVTERLGGVPGNIRFVPAARDLDSYALLRLSDLVLTYASTVGMEAAVQGIPVAVAGDVHYRGRGFTLDVNVPAELDSAITEGVPPMAPHQVEAALRYAFTFFFRLMIPFPPVRAVATHPLRVPDDAAELRPGMDRYVDFVCDRILEGGDFTLPDELALV